MPIFIKSKRDGFRRCGVRHPATETSHPLDRFSREELKILKAEPMLQVRVEPDPEPELEMEDPLDSMTVAGLQAFLTKKKVDFPPRALKPELLDLAKKAAN